LQSRANDVWTTQILPVTQSDGYLDHGLPDAVSLRAVDRLGNLGAPAVWVRKKYTPPDTTKGAAKLLK
jgi:hypothetical protein